MQRVVCLNRGEEQELTKKIEASGFQIIRDLDPLYAMIKYYQRLSGLSKEAKQRVQWFDYYRKHKNVSLVCRYFGISRKTFYKWKERYDPQNLISLEDRDRAPIKRRQREISHDLEGKIVVLRKQYIRYGKEKLKRIYERTHNERISSWQIQKTIEKYQLYYQPNKNQRTQKKRFSALKKKRITELKRIKNRPGFLLCLDVIVIYWNGCKRYIFTAIDSVSRVAFARMYRTKSSYNAEDFLTRLRYLLDDKIENLQTDNGSEFEGLFQRACQRLEIKRYYSRPRTPKDNPVNERFNRTLEDEFIQLGNFNPNPDMFNQKLTDWLIEYNFHRPHQALAYETPINFSYQSLDIKQVLPMWSSNTTS